MKLPVIKQLVKDGQFSQDRLEETIEVLLTISEARGLKDDELEAIGEVISNISGAQEVLREMEKGTPQREALNGFMKRVVGSINR